MAMKGLEDLKAIFEDTRTYFGIGKIVELSPADDNAYLHVVIELYPEEVEVVCRMAWEATGKEAGIFQFPVVDDLVMVCFIDGDEDQAYIIRRLTSKEDKIPAKAMDGHTVIKALSGKEAWITSDEKINLSKEDTSPTEAVVLGNILKTFLTAWIDAWLDAPVIGQGAAPVTLSPAIKALLTQYKSTYLTTASSNILSQLTFTERG